MKLLQQLFGSLFGRSRSKGSINNGNSSSGTANKITHVADVTCRQSVVTADIDNDVAVREQPDSDKLEITTPLSPMTYWSPKANRICWGSPSARRSATRRAGDLEQNIQTHDVRLPRSRSFIRTNPWLPPSSPPQDRRHLCRSPSPASCPSTPSDSPAESSRRWRLAESAGGDGGSGTGDATTPVASEGYCSVSSLCTMSDSATLSTTACSDDMQMSIDSLASLFPTLMSSSSTSFLDDKACGSVVDSGIVVDNDHDFAVHRKENLNVTATGSAKSGRPSDYETSTTNTQKNSKTTSSSSTETVKEHLCAVQSALRCGNSSDYQFDSDVFPFGSEQQKPALPTQHHQKLLDLDSTEPQSRGVEEISSSLADSVERLRRGRVAVDGAFGRALAEDRRRQRELVRLRRRMVEAQREVLLNTLRDLRRDLDDQCRRLQNAYDEVLAARWPQLHANTPYTLSTAAHPLRTMCQSAV